MDVAGGERETGVTSESNRLSRGAVLDGQAATIDDIRAGYLFWTVEYRYSYGDLDKAEPLTRSFANYLVGAEARSMIAAQQYAPCVRGDGTPEPLCTTPRE